MRQVEFDPREYAARAVTTIANYYYLQERKGATTLYAIDIVEKEIMAACLEYVVRVREAEEARKP